MRLKVISLNIWHGGTLWDNLVEFLESEDADILMLQEVYHTESTNLTKNQHHSFTVLADLLDYEFSYYSPAFIEDIDQPDELFQGSAIFSKFPLTPISVTFYDTPFGKLKIIPENFTKIPRNIIQAEVKLEDKKLHLFNTHGIWGEDGQDNERRTAMVNTILEKISQVDQSEPIILAGDFNLNVTTQAVLKIEEKLKNVFGRELSSTFNMKQKTNPGYAESVVDMMFCTPDIKIISKSCPDVNVSDHLPLVVELEV